MIVDRYGIKFRSYKEYLLKSRHWEEIKREKKSQVLGRCEVCDKIKYKKIKSRYYNDIEIHHKHYDNLGHENLTDLIAVCSECHPKKDKERIREKETGQYWRAVETFAYKKYGYETDDVEQYCEEFDEWLESKS